MPYVPPPVSNETINVTKIGTPVGETPIYIFADVLDELRYSATERTARGMLVGIHQVKDPTIRYISLKPNREFDVEKDVSEFVDELNAEAACAEPSTNSGNVAGRGHAADASTPSAEGNATEASVARNSNEDGMDVDNSSDAPKSGTEYVIITAFKDLYPIQDALDYAMYLRRQRNFRSESGDETDVGMVMLSSEPWKIMLEDLMLQRSYCATEWQVALFVDATDAHARAFILTKGLSQLTETGYYLISAKENS
mgnify:CR=1 FL=1